MLFSSVRCVSSVSRRVSRDLVVWIGEGGERDVNDGGIEGIGDETEGVESEVRSALRRGEVRIVTGNSSRTVENVN